MPIDSEPDENPLLGSEMTPPSTVPKSWIKSRVFKSFGMVLLLELGFLALSLLAGAVPNSAITSHLQSAIKGGEWSAIDYSKGTQGDQLDHYTECIALSIGLGRSGHPGLVGRAIADPQLGPCDIAVPALRAWQGKSAAYQDYFRYWNGYTVLTRPILAIAGVRALRIVSAILLWLSVITYFYILVRRVNWLTALALAVPLFATVDFWDLPGSIPHALSMGTAFGGAALIVAKTTPGVGKPRALPMGVDPSWLMWPVLAGCLYGFVDLMTNPPLAWMLSAFSCGLVVLSRANSFDAFKASAASALTWMVGYGGTWAFKWLIDIIAFGWKAFDTQVIHEITYRAGGAASPMQVARINLYFWVGPFHHRSLIAAILIGTALMIMVWRSKLSGALLAIAVGWPAVLTFLWFSIVKEQSFIQAFFAYRSLGMSLAVIVCALVAGGSISSTTNRVPTKSLMEPGH